MRLNETSAYSKILLLKEGVVPTEVQVLRVGKFNHPTYGFFEITSQCLAEMKANFDNNVRGIDTAFDYFHDSDKEAAAWVNKLELKEDGTELWASVTWTPRAEKKLAERELRYFSPDFTFQWKDPETEKVHNNVLFGGGLTNRPFVKEMSPIVASEEKMSVENKNLELGGPGSGPQPGGGRNSPEKVAARKAAKEKAKAANRAAAAAAKKEATKVKAAKSKVENQKAKTEKVLRVANHVEKTGAGSFSRSGKDLQIRVPLGRGSKDEAAALHNVSQIKSGLGKHVSESKFDPQSGNFIITVKNAYETKLSELLINRAIKLNEQGELIMDEKDKKIQELEAKISDLEAMLADYEGPQEAPDMEKMMSDMNSLKEENSKMCSELKSLKEEKAKSDEAKALAEKEAAFTLLLSEGKACAAQKEAYVKGDMNEFIKLAQPLNTKAQGTSVSVTKEEATAKEIIKLAEEKQSKDTKLSRAEALSLAKKELKK